MNHLARSLANNGLARHASSLMPTGRCYYGDELVGGMESITMFAHSVQPADG
jgi:hypothetical protein